MPGGNTSSSKRPYRMMKASGQKDPDTRALSGAETFGDFRNSQLFRDKGEEYDIDTDFGLDKLSGAIVQNDEDTQGNKGWKASDPPRWVNARETRAAKGRGADDTPGGGWDD